MFEAPFKAYFQVVDYNYWEINKQKVTKFWKRFNFRNATDIILATWTDVSKKRLRGVWRKLVPYFIPDF